MTEQKHIIWSSDPDYEDWRGDLEEQYPYLYRAYKENVSEAQIDRLKEKLYSGTATRADVTRVTKRLGDEIGRVYGWRFPPVREAARER